MTARRCPRLTAVILLLAALVLPALTVQPTALPRAAADESEPSFLRVRIDSVTPDLVTATGGPSVTVTGTVSNVGDRPVRDVVARLERAPAVTSPAELRTSLTGSTAQYEAVGEFITLSPELQQDQSAGFAFSYPLRGDTGDTARIDTPGIYPLLVNVNGTPDYGAPARLDDGRFLLPVLGVPPAGAGDTRTAAVTADADQPVAVTMLWPLADQPRLAAGVPGGTTPVRLTDDELATELAPGGRLEALLGAAEFAISTPEDPDGAVNQALCLAVDPDLLVTVNAMSTGYVVDDGPGATRPGAGVDAAAGWLGRLRELAKRMCVVATPYAQANLSAVHRIGDPQLSAFATGGAADLVEGLLGVPPLRGVTLIGDGRPDRPAVDLLDAQGPTVALAAAPDSDTDLAPYRLSGQVVAAPFEPSVAAALAGAGTTPRTPTYLDDALDVPLRDDAVVARRQDAAAAMLWRPLNPDTEPRNQLLVPPLTWSLSADDARALLHTLSSGIRAGLATPRPLSTVLAEAGDPQPPQQPAAADPDAAGYIGDAVLHAMGGQLARLWGLTAALTTNPQTGLTGPQYTAPLREDLLRALSLSEPAARRGALADRGRDIVGGTIDNLIGGVTIVNPGGSYTLATERSPLPLALRNDLGVPIRVRLDVNAPPGMTVTDVGEQELPPGFLPLRVPIEVHFTQRVAVDVGLRTPDGMALGEPVRLSVHSNAYGKVLFFITLGAGAVLAALTGRRLWHRFRGQPDPADLEPPTPHRVRPPAAGRSPQSPPDRDPPSPRRSRSRTTRNRS